MKSLFLATAAVAAFAAAPALAQDAIGSVGVSYNHGKFEAAGSDIDVDGATIDGVVATPAFGDWTVTFNASGSYSDSFVGDETSLSGGVHLSKAVEDMRFGGFVNAVELPAGQNLVTFGAEGQKYLDRATLTGVVSYGTVLDADIWTVGGDAAFYATPALRLNVGASYTDLDLGGAGGTDGWSAGAGAEYQFATKPYSVFAGYERSEVEDLDLTVDAFKVGLRFNFGGDLQSRDRAGATLGRTGNGVMGNLTSLFSAF